MFNKRLKEMSALKFQQEKVENQFRSLHLMGYFEFDGDELDICKEASCEITPFYISLSLAGWNLHCNATYSLHLNYVKWPNNAVKRLSDPNMPKLASIALWQAKTIKGGHFFIS